MYIYWKNKTGPHRTYATIVGTMVISQAIVCTFYPIYWGKYSPPPQEGESALVYIYVYRGGGKRGHPIRLFIWGRMGRWGEQTEAET